VLLLTKLNTGSTFGKANPVPVFETAYPQPTSFSGNSPTSSFGTSFGVPPSGFPSANNHQSDSYGSPIGPVLGQSQFSSTSGFSSGSHSSTPILNGQGSILQNSISAENFSDKFSSSNFGQIFIRKQPTCMDIMDINLECLVF
jgi:hypothetical protein